VISQGKAFHLIEDNDGYRVVRADENFTAFVELESAIRVS
jgi:hypothetical protein